MDDTRTRHWQPIEELPQFAVLIDGQLADAREQHDTFRQIRHRPEVLDESTVTRCIKLYAEQRSFLTVYREQLMRWRKLALTPEQHAEVERLSGQIEQLYQELNGILVLADGVKQAANHDELARRSAAPYPAK